MKRPSNSLQEMREFIREVLMEIAPALAAGRTIDIEGMNAFLRQKGVFGQEENILSIVEGDPTPKVMNDMYEYVAFHNIGVQPEQLTAEVMLQYYLEWNSLNIDPNEVLAFSISETGA